MFDVLLRFNTAAEAATYLPQYSTAGTTWDMANVIPDVKAWQDSAQGGLLGGILGTVTGLVFLSGYWTWISLTAVPHDVTNLLAVQLCYDRDALNAKQAKSIYKTSLGLTLLNDIRASPVYQGADVPWGSLSSYK